MNIQLLGWVAAAFVTSSALISYDCAGDKPNITTISLLEIQECHKPIKRLEQTDVYIQLVQSADYTTEHVTQCKVSIQRHITHCGMHSHTSEVKGGYETYILPVGRQTCLDMHKYHKLQLYSNILIDQLGQNETTHRSITLAGAVNFDGKCSGGEYSDQYGSWSDVVVQAIVTTTLADYWAPVQLVQNQIRLRSGTACQYLTYQCVDPEGGETFWNKQSYSLCDIRQYTVLYEGPAIEISSIDDTIMHENRTVTTKETTFALAVRAETYICSQLAKQTEHPKLSVVVGSRGKFLLKREKVISQNLDIFTYINSKLIYVEKHVSREMSSLFAAVQSQKCELERQVLRNLLNLAVIAPEQFAYNFMKSPGYTAIMAGEVVHVIKCTPVDVTVRKTAECYNELPVSLINQSLFMTPRNHILQKHGTEIDCNPFTTSIYSLHGSWYKLVPSITESREPNVLKPAEQQTWSYQRPGDLAASGIYSMEDLTRLTEQFMFPAEKQAVLNTISRSVTGVATNLQGIKIHGAFTEEAFNHVMSNTLERMWGWFAWIGNIITGFVGIWFIAKLTKFILDTILHGWTLYRVFGFGFHLLGAFWDSVTNVILHVMKPNNKTQERDKNMPADEDLNEMERGSVPPCETDDPASRPYHNIQIQLREVSASG